MLFFYLRLSDSENEYLPPVIVCACYPHRKTSISVLRFASRAAKPKPEKKNAGRSKKPSLPTVHAAKQSKPNKMNAGTGRSTKKPSLPAVHEEVQSTPGPSKKVYEKVKPQVAELAQELGYEDQYLPEISQIQNQSVPVTPTENGQEFRFFNTSTPIQAEAAKPKSNKSKAQETETPTKPKGRGGRPKHRKNDTTLMKEKLAKAAKGEFKMKGRC